jgi:hypothetical protein
MAETITIDPDLIAAHAARVDQVAGDIGVARSAGGSTNMAGGAFGVMCAFLVPAASMVASMAMSAITSAEDMVKRSSTELKEVVKDFTTTEDAIIADVKSIQSGLEK